MNKKKQITTQQLEIAKKEIEKVIDNNYDRMKVEAYFECLAQNNIEQATYIFFDRLDDFLKDRVIDIEQML